jgi:hypothetical protein
MSPKRTSALSAWVLVDAEAVVLGIDWGESELAQAEVVQVRIGPTERDLQDPVQLAESCACRNAQPAPHGRLDVPYVDADHESVRSGCPLFRPFAYDAPRARVFVSSIVDNAPPTMA